MPRGGARPTSPGDLIRRKQARLRRAAEQRGEAPAEASTQTSTPVTAPAAERNRARVWRDFIRPRGGQVVVGIILFVTGLGLVMGLKAGQQEADFATMSREELIGVLDTLNADERSLSSEIEQLQLTKAQLESGVDSARVADEEAARRLATMRILAGTAPATGPGIRITIRDPQGNVGPELALDAIEELRDAGAEVLEINDEIRVVASTWFGEDPTTGNLTVDGVVVNKPLVIEVIGDPKTLEAGARFRGGLVSEVQSQAVGGSVDIEVVDTLEITATVTPTEPQFAKPS